ncbi:MAG: hypothetical protein AVDCRST_MAG07-2876 [uncultured Frankineae bacterium]|uniref:DUF350 domain-containing protein n=1 Tax=uncultured Frankineae bacterium TaxID=437475 RepID=A0A6J4M3S3_9ACTN|nr:MAG: hypothetical protein AVDCRST_MAG07-2876 [uncultured Frankineae bacterium]
MTDLLEELAGGVLATLSYALVGTIVLAVGYVVLDAITPGNLRHLVYSDHNRNAAVLVGANVLALAGIVTTAIATSDDDLARGLADSAVYGLLGIALLAASFKVLDRLTPGDLGAICTDPEGTPAVYVTAAFQIGLGAVLAVAIS